MKKQTLLDRRYPFWLALPAVIIFSVFFILPIIMGTGLSMTNWDMELDRIDFVGLRNYVNIFSDKYYWMAAKNTLIFAVSILLLRNILALLLAFCLTDKLKTRNFLRTIFYIPSVLSYIVVGILFTAILKSDGLLNRFLSALGFTGYIDWLGNGKMAMELLGARLIGGGLYSYWPVDYTQPFDKQEDWKRSVESIKALAPVAKECGITLCMEVLNRFEGYLLNTAEEGVRYVREVNEDNVKLMLDTFHMNIEESSMTEAIRQAGPLLGHFHTGEPNRMPPGAGRMPWFEIGRALQSIGYEGPVVMEPFVRPGGTVGQNIKIWRDLTGHALTTEELDEMAKQAVQFQKYVLEC